MCIIDKSMPKKTRPITVLTAQELDVLDNATFAELAADEERLQQALPLEDPSTIRSDRGKPWVLPRPSPAVKTKNLGWSPRFG